MKKYNIGNFIFFVVLVAVGLAFYIMPNKPSVSEKENRTLAKKPEFSAEKVLSGEFASEYESYFADNFPFREQLVDAANELKQFKGTKGSDDYQVVVVEDVDDAVVYDGEEGKTEDKKDNAAKEQQPSEEEQPNENAVDEDEVIPDVEFEDGQVSKSGFIVCGDTVLTPAYQKKSVIKSYTSAINSFADAHPEVNTYCGVIPIASAYYMPEKFRRESNDQQKNINNIYEMLNENVKTVDIYSNLQKHANEYIFFRTDHHWTARGAYYAYQQFMRRQGYTAISLIDLEVYTTYEKYLGTLYSKVGGNAEMRANPDRVIVYDIPVKSEARYWTSRSGNYYVQPLLAKNIKTSNKYMAFTYGDHGFIEIISENKNGKAILVIKDSFGNAFVPYLTMDYEYVLVMDPRYGQLPYISNLIKDYGLDDVLFLTNVTNTSVSNRVKEITRVSKT